MIAVYGRYHIWHVIFRSSVVILITNCFMNSILPLYFRSSGILCCRSVDLEQPVPSFPAPDSYTVTEDASLQEPRHVVH